MTVEQRDELENKSSRLKYSQSIHRVFTDQLGLHVSFPLGRKHGRARKAGPR